MLLVILRYHPHGRTAYSSIEMIDREYLFRHLQIVIWHIAWSKIPNDYTDAIMIVEDLKYASHKGMNVSSIEIC